MKNKRKKETIGIIKGIDLVKKSSPRAKLSFKSGKYMVEKDRPRDKSYKKYNMEDWNYDK